MYRTFAAAAIGLMFTFALASTSSAQLPGGSAEGKAMKNPVAAHADSVAAGQALFAKNCRFCHGDTPTMADCCLGPQVANGKRFDCDFSHVPNVMRIYDECGRLEAFQKSAPANQPDAE